MEYLLVFCGITSVVLLLLLLILTVVNLAFFIRTSVNLVNLIELINLQEEDAEELPIEETFVKKPKDTALDDDNLLE